MPRRRRRAWWSAQAYNELMRKLVAFVKKMDPRVKRRKQEAEDLERERAAHELDRLEKRKAERQRRRVEAGGGEERLDEDMERMLDFEFDHCPVASGRDAGADGGDGDGAGEEPRAEAHDGPEDFYCIVCKKRFKYAGGRALAPPNPAGWRAAILRRVPSTSAAEALTD